MNVLSNVVLLVFGMLVNVWLVRYLIAHLGVAAYGVVPLAASITAYLGLLTLSFNSAAGRYLTIDLEQGRFASANRTFNTGFFLSLGLMALVLPASSLIVWQAPNLFRLPAGQQAAGRLLFALVLLTFMLTTLESNFSISSWARNRFDLRNGVALISRLAQVGLLLLTFRLFGARLWLVGIGILGAALVSFLGSRLLWRRLTPDLCVNIRLFDRSRLREMTGMSGWMLVNHLGAILLLNVDLIIVNRCFGPEMSGRYGTLLQLSIMIRSFAGAVAIILAPTILARHARQDHAAVDRIARQSVRLLGLALALPIGALCGFARPFLQTWLGATFTALAPLLVLLVAPLAVNLAVLPLFSTQIALKAVRWPGIVTLLSGAANLGLALALVSWTRLGMLGVALAGAIVLTLKNAVFTAIYGAKIRNAPWWQYLQAMLPGLLATLAVALVTGGLSKALALESWLALGACALVVSVSYCALVGVFGLKPEERVLLRGLMPHA
jgi:membrane protein EpsK